MPKTRKPYTKEEKRAAREAKKIAFTKLVSTPTGTKAKIDAARAYDDACDLCEEVDR